jgi:hypothetical protein
LLGDHRFSRALAWKEFAQNGPPIATFAAAGSCGRGTRQARKSGRMISNCEGGHNANDQFVAPGQMIQSSPQNKPAAVRRLTASS